MVDELKRNGSGYYDPTAYKAMKNIEKGENAMKVNKGEIWEINCKNGTKMAVIIASHGSYCSVLTLCDEERESRNVKVYARGAKYTEAGMISYAFNDSFVEFIRVMGEAEFSELLEKVAESLGFKSEKTVDVALLKAELAEAKKEIKMLESEKVCDKSVDTQEVVALKAQLEIYKEQNKMLFERLIGA